MALFSSKERGLVRFVITTWICLWALPALTDECVKYDECAYWVGGVHPYGWSKSVVTDGEYAYVDGVERHGFHAVADVAEQVLEEVDVFFLDVRDQGVYQALHLVDVVGGGLFGAVYQAFGEYLGCGEGA